MPAVAFQEAFNSQERPIRAERAACESALVGDTRISYYREGTGEVPVLLLHGWPQTSSAWHGVAPLLGSRCDVVVPDLPGFGYSSKPESGFDKKTVARRLREFVHQLGLSRIALVGHDVGGQVAYAYAAQWPDEVSHLVFIESGLAGFGLERALDVANGGSWHHGFNMAGDIAEELVRGREYLLVDYMIRREKSGLFDCNAVTDAEVRHYAQMLARPGALRSSFGYYRTLMTDRDDNRLMGQTPLPMPTLAVGANGGYGPASALTLHQVARNVEEVLIERCGHYIPEERPTELARAILEFLAKPIAGHA